MDSAILVALSDLHLNSTVAGAMPEVRIDGGTCKASKLQTWLRERHLELVDGVADVKARTGLPVVTIINGEIADDNHHKTSELMTLNPALQIRHALEYLEPIREVSDYIIVTRGTEAHSGVGSNMDETIAYQIGAVKTRDGDSSHSVFRGDIAGVRVWAAHHPGAMGGNRKWSSGGAERLAADIMLSCLSAKPQVEPPDLVFGAHVHREADSGDYLPTRVIVTPSNQLTTAYGHRIGAGLKPPPSIGGMFLQINKGKVVTDWKYYFDWPIEQEEHITWDEITKK